MQIDIITIFPDMFKEIFEWGIVSQGTKKGKIKIKIHDLRDWTTDKHKQVDDRPFGGGVGMVMMVEPLFKAIATIKANDNVNPFVIYTSPKGKTLNQELSEKLSQLEHIIIICGRYEGVDQRVIDNLVDAEISIGDYVLSGGEIPAMVIVDSIARLIPEVIKNSDFNKDESFSDPTNRELLDYPQYTRPEDFKGYKVPEVLLSGNHAEIAKWRKAHKKMKPI